MSRPKIAIIGAGMSGLSAVQILQSRLPLGDYEIKLFDKSRGVGGRMSTRYTDAYEFDHGAQYFTAKDPEFKAVIEGAMKAGAAAPWAGRALYLKSSDLVKDTGKDRYVGTPRMNSLPKFLAKDLDITLGRHVSKITRHNGKWNLEFKSNSVADIESDQNLVDPNYEAVICTSPPAQAQALLPDEFSELTALKSAKMQACFALMVGLPKTVDFGWDSLRLNGLPVAWMAVNSTKPQRNSDVTTLIIHADAQWSEAHQDADRDWVQTRMLEVAAQTFAPDLASELLNAPHKALHRWLYASVDKSPEQPCLFDKDLKLVACGDWCLGGRVEGAWRSGAAAGQALIKALK